MGFLFARKKKRRNTGSGSGSQGEQPLLTLAGLTAFAEDHEVPAPVQQAAQQGELLDPADCRAIDWAALALQMHQRFGTNAAQSVLDLAIRIHGHERSLDLATLEIWRRESPWQVIEVLRAASPEMLEDVEWQSQYARVAQIVGALDEADTAFRRVQQRSEDPARIAFRRGLMWRYHDDAKADEAFAEAIELDETSPDPLDARRLGLGVFYQRVGDPEQAVVEYEKTVQLHPELTEVLIRIARCQHRQFDWERSAEAARRALQVDDADPRSHFVLGLALERQEQWDPAAESFERAISLGYRDSRRAIYRRGFCLANAGHVEAAATAFNALPMPKPGRLGKHSADPKRYFSLPKSLEARWIEGHEAVAAGDWETARAAFADVARRSHHHHPDIGCAWGKAAVRTGDPVEAVAAFCEVQVFRQPDYIKVPRWETEPGKRRTMTYSEWSTRLPVDPGLILWESFQGASISCNPKALFDHVVNRPEFADTTHVWVVEDADQPLPAEIVDRPNVIVAERRSELYLRVLATAGHLVTNTTFPGYFSRRPEQKYLNTWHGTPLKSLGIAAAPRGELVHANVARNLLHATHLALPNEHTRDVLLSSNQVEGLLGAQVAVTGSPRLDDTLTRTAALREQMCGELGLDPGRPIVFYAPTWRDADDASGSDPVAAAIDSLSGVEGASVLVKLHHLDPARDRTWPAGVVAVPDVIDTYAVLAAADVLVTDYSSVMFDFMPLRRPLLLFVPDAEHYTATRGLAMRIDEVPAERVTSAADLRAAVERAVREGAGDPDTWLDALVEHEDGSAADRVRRFFFEDEPLGATSRRDESTTVLIHASMIPNGVTSSLLNLLPSLTDQDVRIVLLVNRESIRRDVRRHGELERVPSSVQILAVPDPNARTLEEAWIHQKFNRTQRLGSAAQWDVYWESIERDARRMLGSFSPDAAVEFDGYARYWSSLMRFMGQNNVVYQHSTMYEEFLTRAPRLESQFAVCRITRPQLVSVSRPILEQNARDLSEHFGVPTDLYRLVPNQIDPDRIQSLAAQPLDEDIAAWLDEDSHLFISIGRLSIEKNHELLIDAFARFAEAQPRARLLIVGSGFLGDTLRAQVDRLGLGDRVHFAGQRSNPFPALARADSLVVSSLHEGQPMVVLEAMVLGTRVLSTQLPGVREMTAGLDAVFVDSDPESMASGMATVLAPAGDASSFDAESYRTTARDTFLRVVAGTEPPALAGEVAAGGSSDPEDVLIRSNHDDRDHPQ